MIFVYNFLHLTLLPLIPALLLFQTFGRRRGLKRTLQRLGLAGLPGKQPADSTARLWFHCLSVGELTSALPLIQAVREQMPDSHITLTVSTRSGMDIAGTRAADLVDSLLYSPFDLLPTVHRFLSAIRPDIFVLVETDFWPNWIHGLNRGNVPMMLVNGRISAKSYRNYTRFRRLFTPMFSTFSTLAMQTAADAGQMRGLGVSPARIRILGNLKYARSPVSRPGRNNGGRKRLGLPLHGPVWVCGSTHAGEEEILLDAYLGLKKTHPDLVILIAPRDPARGGEIAARAARKGLGSETALRSADQAEQTQVLILDTLGELADCYGLAHVAFIGGSLVPCGGHNPLEAAAFGVPVLFGPHMEDFQEIARDLTACGGAATVRSLPELKNRLETILRDRAVHGRMSAAATGHCRTRGDIIEKHLDCIAALLGDRQN